MGLEYGAAKKIVLKTILILGGITIIEVIIALTGKGYIISGVHWPWWFIGIAMIVLSLTKAYYIVYEFMHMKYEVPSLVKSVLLPTVLLIWAIIAFMWEGNDWENRRSLIQDKNREGQDLTKPIGQLTRELQEADFRF